MGPVGLGGGRTTGRLTGPGGTLMGQGDVGVVGLKGSRSGRSGRSTGRSAGLEGTMSTGRLTGPGGGRFTGECWWGQ